MNVAMPKLYNLYEMHHVFGFQWILEDCMLTHEIEARKRLHDHVMEESDWHQSQVEKPNQPYELVLLYVLYYVCTYIERLSSAKFVA